MRILLLACVLTPALNAIGLSAEQPPSGWRMRCPELGSWTPEDDIPQIVFETRIISLPADLRLAKIPMKEGGVAFLSNAEYLAAIEAVQADVRATTLQAPKTTVFDGRMATISTIHPQTFVSGVEVNRVNGAVCVAPKKSSIDVGITLNLRGVLSADRKSIAATIDYREVKVGERIELIPLTFPITPVYEGGSQGPPVPVTQYLQAPDIQTIALEKSNLRIPSGCAAIIAGPTFVQEVREESQIAFLGDLPYVGMLFHSTSYSKVRMRSVLIVSVRTIEPAPATGAPQK
jgi:type II secretory pathway component GspD/PulD (secretin)